MKFLNLKLFVLNIGSKMRMVGSVSLFKYEEDLMEKKVIIKFLEFFASDKSFLWSRLQRYY